MRPTIFWFALIAHIVLAASVFGQSFSCNEVDADAPFLRSEGQAELVGDIRISCKGGTPGTTNYIDVKVFLNAQVGNRILNAATNETDALLFIGDPAAPVLGTNLFQGVRTIGPSGLLTVLTFRNVPFSTSINSVLYRISNIGVNATTIGTNAAPQPSTILAFITATGPFSSVPINNPQQRVGFVVSGQSMQLQTAAGVNLPGLSFTNPSGENAALIASSFANGAVVNHLIRFDEGFASSMRRRNKATTFTNVTALVDQSIFGTSYGTETGYYNSALPSSINLAGLATQGTRLIARFTNIPAGVSIFATINQTAGSTSSAKARLITTDAQGAGLFTATAQTTTASIGGASMGIAPLVISGGYATATWEVTDSDAAALESLTFGLVTAYPSATASIASVLGNFGPQTFPDIADTTSDMPRFRPGPSITNFPSTCTANCLIVPEAITFTYTVGGALTAPIALPVSSSGSPVAFTAMATTSGMLDLAPPNTNWLTISAASGTTPAALLLSVNPAGFAPGKYPGFITIAKADGSSAAKRVFVVLNVRPLINTALGTIRCDANAGVPPILRFPGLTERIGDLVVNCVPPTGGAPTLTTNVQVSLNTTVTSRISGTISDALLMVNEPTPSEQLSMPQLLFRGIQTSSNTILFRNVVIPFTGGTTTTFRIVNLFADTSIIGVASTGIPSQLTAYIAAPGLTLSGSALALGFIQNGMIFDLRDATNTTKSGITFPGSSATGPTGAPVSSILSFKEGFYSSFERRNIATTVAAPFALRNQNIPGNIWDSETGFYNSNFPAVSGFNTTGLATQGTRLFARFQNVPAGVSLYVTTAQLPTTSTAIAARLTQNDANGAGAYNAVVPSATGTFGTASVGLAPVTLSGGSGIVAWEFFGNDNSPLTFEELRFGVVAVYNTPQTGTATVTGMLAPLSTVNTADTTAPMPRFPATLPALAKCIDLTCLTVPSSITLNSTDGKPASATFSIIDNGQPTPFTVQTTGESWLRVSPFGGSSPGTMTITADPTTVSGGTYTGSVTLTTDTPGSYAIPVTFQVVGPVVVPPPPARRLPVPENQ